MVGFETADDAAVYRLSDDMAALLTVDFFTPIVDDPYDFGRIAAVNSLSDIYAMGGTPLAAMNLLAFPSDLGPDVIAEVVRGGADVVRSAGAVVVGGHTIEDAEPKYGMAVMGIVHPDKVIRNVGALPGDALVLTKPIGVGIMTTALKRGLETEDTLSAVIDAMARLNRQAASAMVEVGVHAATDVTGFGLIGHLREMASGSGVAARVNAERIPVWPGALAYAAEAVCPGRTKDLLAFLAEYVEWGERGLDWQSLLSDPQTSGGLLIAVAPEKMGDLLAALERGGDEGAVIGEFAEGPAGRIEVV
jgi:selenide, water dikinase